MNSAPPRARSPGQVLHCRLALAQAPETALRRLPFLGGMLHGLVSSVWWDELPRAAPGQDPSQFRIIAPPVTQNSWLDPRQGLQFQILLAEPLAERRQALELALRNIRHVTDGAERYVVQEVQTQWLPLAWPEPSARAGAAETVTLSLQWLTPLHMVSRRQLAAGFGDQPPSLKRIVRSLVRRASDFSPAWAQALGLASPAWRNVEEHWHDAVRLEQDTKAFAWRYGSRTKQTPVLRHGLVGGQAFAAKTNAVLETLMLAGQWLGVGEGASFGCGGYVLTIE